MNITSLHGFSIALASFTLVFTACSANDSSKQETSLQESALTSRAPTDTWPRQLKASDGTIYTLYQPQVDTWNGDILSTRTAVSVQQTGDKAPTYGILFLSVQTQTDKQSRTVAFEKVTVTKVLFPSAEDKANGWLTQLQSLVPQEVHSVSLDRLEASLAISSAKKVETQPLKNDPPEIIFSEKPTLLILLDGEPQWRPLAGTTLQRAINTHALLLKDIKGTLYLHLWDGYVESASIKGPWKPTGKLPYEFTKVQSQLVAAKQVDLLAGQKDPGTGKMPGLASTPLPDLVIATKPTELIVTAGDPKWTPIEGTNLLYVANTSAHIFKETSDQQTYILISGRWFKSPDFKGPWNFVSPSSLPKDFANIPDNCPQENVKASIPGTPQSQEAVIANSIPQTTRIERAKAVLSPAPVYDGGTPQWTVINGTPLHYAINSTTPVIQIDAKTFYACQNGVWFVATSFDGPWVVATSVPTVVYTIPASCPIYYVTFVRIYRFDETYVWTGYTPGYYGAYITPDGVVVYGTGYYYAPYTGTTVYVAYPVTYGYDSTLCWTPWAGWYFGFAAGWAWGDWYYWSCYPPAPYWGPYWPYCYGWGYNEYGGITAWGPYGWAGTSGDIYHNNGPWSSVSRATAGYDGITGNQWASQYGHAYNSTTGTKVAGQRGAIENVYTGNYAYGSRGVAYNQNTGGAAWGQHGTIGNEGTGNQISGGHGGFYNPNTGQVTHIAGAHGENGGVLDVNGNVYAGKDGHVYQRNSDGSWNQLTRPSPGQGANSGREIAPITENNQSGSTRFGQDGAGQAHQEIDRASLEREHAARQNGFSRAEGFQRSRPSFSRGGFGGGGFHGFRR
ncbi:MAG: hypothetical protein LBV12_01385 [Puniceicoccales bacterium]|jgi:hypothetical protein|nr:hypothetical protein [Puniceicoccales bacterium]